MPRGLTAGMLAALDLPVIYPVAFYQGEFVSGTVYLWTGIGDRVWNGNTYKGGGGLIGCGPVTESSGFKADGLLFTLSGVPNDRVRMVLTEVRHKQIGQMWFGLTDTAGGAIIPDPVQLFTGRLDAAVVKKGRKTSTIAITYETRLINAIARNRRYTDADQQIDYLGDTGFRYLTALQDKNLAAASSGANGVASSGSSGDPARGRAPRQNVN